MKLFGELLQWRDLLDIGAVAVVIYYLLRLIRGTRAVQVLSGAAVVGVVYWVARLVQLETLRTILGSLLLFLPFALIVLFQQEIRRALASFGRNPFFGLTISRRVQETFNEFLVAASTLSSHRTGALIVIERLDGLRGFIENGIAIDATLSYDLLVNIFSPETPLHDGAVIVQGDRIAAAACFLPLTLNPELSKEFGTRHRAAIGITQETDAVAIVVSEETGIISLAFDGKLTRHLDTNGLRNLLYRHLITDLYAQGRRTG